MEKKLNTFEILGYLDIISALNIPKNIQIAGISIDTRTIQSGEVFVALKGENFDGHQFVEDALQKGAPFCIVEQSWYDKFQNLQIPILVVPNTLVALGDLSNLYRKKFEIPIVAIAGSNGKTTTKDFVAHILSQKYNVIKTEANYNNQIGVPLTLFRMNDSYEVGVFEIGTNQFGEIFRLCEILEPNFGLITNIGKEHLQEFIDLDGVETEETSLYAYLMKHDGLAFINTDDERLRKYAKIIEKKFTYGQSEENNLRFSFTLDSALFPTISFEYEDTRFTAKLTSKGISVALAGVSAVAVGLAFGLDVSQIVEGLQTFQLPNYGKYGRMQVQQIGNLTIINDTYNANPSSMKLALDTLNRIDSNGRKIAILGDMLELGTSSLEEHIEILHLAENICDLVYIFGSEMKAAFENIKTQKTQYFQDKSEIAKQLLSNLNGNEVLLFKASRGMRCEDILTDFLNNIK
jgi:UDP-N-acetylmuramoyl-tripeptide--D-alanyl-D-alanine ligase